MFVGTFEPLLLFFFLICLNLFLVKSKIPLIQVIVGLFSVVVGMLINELPLFPYLNLMIVIIGIVDIVSAISDVRSM